MMNRQPEVKKALSILVDNIRERRRVLRLSQEQLAEKADLSVNYVSKIEVGLKIPSLSTTVRLAKALEMEPSDILAEGAPKEMDDAQELGFALRSLPEAEAEFLLSQFRASLKLIRKLLKDKSNGRG
jgi:transcriptional regulator with XRE-family HTH domain